MGSADAKPFGVAASIPARRPPAAPAVEAEPTPVAQGPVVNLMVQIAAVSHAADAQTLSSALRHDGFAAMVRTATGDPFFHVQVGPFHSVSEAKAMRARLADSGYNAFIKP
ncbi:SPOR domain-containing protein [Acidipila sp. EB88]|uniref:SPOR domain-containing protein n=1 Tax=Acidipila sp. EB88 TaxID=2305226 RepID=UPI000F5D536F|nr:SPOR domain-containing protein [Acidipila sp. EB88]RRA47472.1 SPOR domain-containing protein [Acidipila sp. EB88]